MHPPHTHQKKKKSVRMCSEAGSQGVFVLRSSGSLRCKDSVWCVFIICPLTWHRARRGIGAQ